jgi:hypothetical protein
MVGRAMYWSFWMSWVEYASWTWTDVSCPTDEVFEVISSNGPSLCGGACHAHRQVKRANRWYSMLLWSDAMIVSCKRDSVIRKVKHSGDQERTKHSGTSYNNQDARGWGN